MARAPKVQPPSRPDPVLQEFKRLLRSIVVGILAMVFLDPEHQILFGAKAGVVHNVIDRILPWIFR